MLKFNLEQALLLKGIEKPSTWLRKNAGLTYQAAHRLLQSKVRNLELATLEKICIHLHCTPNDLIQWTSTPKTGTLPNHPLQQLAPRDLPNVSQRLKKLSIDQLMELNKKIDELEGLV